MNSVKEKKIELEDLLVDVKEIGDRILNACSQVDALFKNIESLTSMKKNSSNSPEKSEKNKGVYQQMSNYRSNTKTNYKSDKNNSDFSSNSCEANFVKYDVSSENFKKLDFDTARSNYNQTIFDCEKLSDSSQNAHEFSKDNSKSNTNPNFEKSKEFQNIHKGKWISKSSKVPMQNPQRLFENLKSSTLNKKQNKKELNNISFSEDSDSSFTICYSSNEDFEEHIPISKKRSTYCKTDYDSFRQLSKKRVRTASLPRVQHLSKELSDSGSNVNRTNSKDQKKKENKSMTAIRNKKDRAELNGYKCEMCNEFYDILKEEANHDYCSRHRAKYDPPSTPEGFYDTSI